MIDKCMKNARVLLASVLALCLVACGGGADSPGKPSDEAGSPGTGPSASSTPDGGIPEGIWAAEPVEGAVEIRDLVGKVEDGAEVRIAGRVKDFVESRAMFTIVDNALLACSDRPDDHCPQPWDYCCEDATEVARKTVTVELHDEEGKPLRHPFKGAHGLDHLDRITLSGKAYVNEAGSVRVVLARLHRPTE